MPSDKDPLLRKTRISQLCTFLLVSAYAETRNMKLKGQLIDLFREFSLSASLFTKPILFVFVTYHRKSKWSKVYKRYFLKWSPTNLKRRYQLQLIVSEYYINSNIQHYNGIFNPVTDYLNTLFTDKIKVFKCYRHVLVMISCLPIWTSVPFVFICT